MASDAGNKLDIPSTLGVLCDSYNLSSDYCGQSEYRSATFYGYTFPSPPFTVPFSDHWIMLFYSTSLSGRPYYFSVVVNIDDKFNFLSFLTLYRISGDVSTRAIPFSEFPLYAPTTSVTSADVRMIPAVILASLFFIFVYKIFKRIFFR